jgi:hypothetical protein
MTGTVLVCSADVCTAKAQPSITATTAEIDFFSMVLS